MSYNLLLPAMGESVSEATIVKWLKHPGDYVAMDEAVLEIATDKVDSDVPSPVAGILVEQKFSTDEVAQIGDVLAIIREQGEDGQQEEGDATLLQEIEKQAPLHSGIDRYEEVPGLQLLNDQEHKSEPVPSNGSDRFYSPLVRTIVEKEGLTSADLDRIQGTGIEGRVTKHDVLNYVNAQAKKTVGHEVEKAEVRERSKPVEDAERPKAEEGSGGHRQEMASPAARSVTGSDEIIEMDRMRRLIADHMVKSVHTAPHVCSFVEADVTPIVEWRNRVKAGFEKRENEKITFTPIFIEAVAKALKDFPMVNVSVDGTKIIKKKDINIGMATALPNGNLIVPVIKRADQLNLVGLAKAVNSLAKKARNNKLDPDDVAGGTFTLTNIGSFGNVMGTPIINQPQVAIMAVGTITKKPAVIETPQGDLIGIRHMMFLSMSYDHRVVDGALGGMFIRRVADYLEAWDTKLEI